MKMSKNIIVLSVTIVILISLVAIATYSYFTASVNINNKITTNVKMPLRPTFIVSGGGALSLMVTRNMVLQENHWNGDSSSWVEGKNRITAEKNISVTLTGEPGTTCTYNIYYKDISSNGNYVYSHTGGSADIDCILYNNNGDPVYWQTYKSVSQTSAGVSKITALFENESSTKPTITIPSGSNSVVNNWKFSLVFINRNYDQSALAGKTFKGEVYIDDVSCS